MKIGVKDGMEEIKRFSFTHINYSFLNLKFERLSRNIKKMIPFYLSKILKGILKIGDIQKLKKSQY